jgi:ATP-dependent RNA helicase RhlE
MSTRTFADLGLSAPLLAAVAAQGYHTPTDIQARAIPPLLNGEDLLGTAQTGTGKTAAFVLPLLQRLAGGGREQGRSRTAGAAGAPARPAALILAPTRELAIQIDGSVAAYGAGSGISHLAVFGGAPKGRQLSGLRAAPLVLTATPGRLLDFVGEGVIDLSGVEVFILDEADRMLDMGFIPDVRRIAKLVVHRRQTVLFSATMPQPVEVLAAELLGKAERIAVAPQEVTVDRIKQSVLHVAREDKATLLPELIRGRNMFRVLVFTRTKHRAARVAKSLRKTGIPSDEIHGNRSQNQRQSALERFRSGRVQVLVGTDVAARGIDVDDITHVINYEIPHEPETYVHRIGRTARAGSAGEALSMCDVEELRDFRQIERLLERPVDIDREHRYHREPETARGPKRGGSGAKRPPTHGGGGGPRRSRGAPTRRR